MVHDARLEHLIIPTDNVHNSGIGKTFLLVGGAQFITTHRVVINLYNNL